jgi:hypothetical protein
LLLLVAKEVSMEPLRTRGDRRRQEGRVGWILLWLLGIPIPVLPVLYVLRGCT